MKFKNKMKVRYTFLPKIISCTVALFAINAAAQAQTAASVEDLVETLSGGALKTEKKAVPYNLVADFDGDKIKDVAVIVSLADTAANIGKKLKIQYPYYGEKEVGADDLALFIIHGKGKGWQFAQKSSVLFLGRNSALIFQKARLGESGERNNWELRKEKSGKASLLFGTEASDGTMKWNGKKYVWTESEP